MLQRLFPAARRDFAAGPLDGGLLGAGLLAAAFVLLSARPVPALSAPHAVSVRAAAHVRVAGAWIPQPPPGAEVAAAYLTLLNPGREPAVLVSVDCPLAASAEVHETTNVGGESRMRMIERVTIPPGGQVTLKPGGLHVMLQQIKAPLAVGQRVPLVLHFAGGEELRIEAKVRPLGSL